MGAKKNVGGEKTNYGGKSKKAFLTVTLVTVLSILAVIAVYAAVFLGSFQGGEVTIGGMGSANITYSANNVDPGSWASTLQVAPSGAWYSRLEVAASGYEGPVTISWTLQQENNTWQDVPSAAVSTSMVLNGSAQNVYASTDGTITNNINWGSFTSTNGTYRVYVSVDSS